MEPNLFAHNENHATSCHATNTNDVMSISHNMYAPASQPSLDTHDMLEITYWHAICAH